MYEDSKRGSQSVATRQIPVSELLARHRTEQAPSPQWQHPSMNEVTTEIPVYRDEQYEDVVYGGGDVDEFEAEFETETPVEPVEAPAEAETERLRLAADTPSGELYIRELLQREGKLPREERRKQVPKIAAAAAGVAALCGAVTASVLHIQAGDDTKNLSAGTPGVPLTVVDNGGPRGQGQDVPMSTNQNGTVLIPPTQSSTEQPTTKGPRVAPYVNASTKAAAPSSTAPSSQAPAPSSSAPAPTTTPSSSTPPTSSDKTPTTSTPSTPSATPPSSSNPAPPPAHNSGGGLLGTIGGVLDPITGLLG
ncbi:hypothetical protein BC739_008706 [Kutzneria viridogrisea]|uniref:Uncharacterized protein n=2 Tax=Kutzneria TaxID=43356 RepID=W5WL46_9PSEU|nr:hypothetical protein [Kutzneria albida]AHI01491.1 hypothetical protein KALB_8133 [Kutzneria albida DSM 43870]MBA8931454.1 hypothetical protein [Kutzneria viridogrisea]